MGKLTCSSKPAILLPLIPSKSPFLPLFEIHSNILPLFSQFSEVNTASIPGKTPYPSLSITQTLKPKTLKHQSQTLKTFTLDLTSQKTLKLISLKFFLRKFHSSFPSIILVSTLEIVIMLIHKTTLYYCVPFYPKVILWMFPFPVHTYPFSLSYKYMDDQE